MVNQPATTQPAALPAQKPTVVRYGVLGLLALAAASAYLTRHCIAAANTTIQEDLGFDAKQMGWIMGVFNIGYLVFQVPGGWLGNRFGARKALPLLSVAWSLCTTWTASVSAFASLVSSRVVFGLAQAGLVPNAAKVVRDWFPPQRRGLASAVIGASMSIGAVVTMKLTAELLRFYHWRTVFHAYALVGIAWAVVFYLFFRATPRDHPWTNRAEQDLVDSDSSEDDDDGDAQTPVPSTRQLLGALTASGTLRLICGQEFLRAAGYTLLVTWFPAFLEQGLGVSRKEAGEMTSQTLAAVVVGSLLGGFVVDYLFRRTGSRRLSRSGTMVVALGVCALMTLVATRLQTVDQQVGAVVVGSFFFGLSTPAVWTATLDIAGPWAAVVMATMNMFGTAGSLASPVVNGYLIDYIQRTDGNWFWVLYLTAAIYAGCAAFWLAIDSEKTMTINSETAAKRDTEL